MGTSLVDGLGLIAWGIAIGFAGLLLLREYRRLFFQNPRAVMTLEVLFQIALKSGAPGYLAGMLFMAAIIFIAGGVFTLGMEAFHILRRL